ncbi:hypothetical protein AU196_05560 [Mycobacterium sp. IS-1742]|uniref:hypothetical protein n=1 Tax=Mycobacterium sp. IS-1742 TaxID=1772285 RepID=UPI000740445D|nr:hypothetical protein [Mycobacterium sp. IS-1742]KUI28020.1 hypothetical protein AU196_05560 [Mycobacterium sp. IS-1742]
MNTFITIHAPVLRAVGLSTVAAAVAVGAILAGPAAPARADSAATTIHQLEATGFDVRVTRVGSAPLEECQITEIGRPREQKRLTLVEDRDDDRALIPVVVKRTITVSLNCA